MLYAERSGIRFLVSGIRLRYPVSGVRYPVLFLTRLLALLSAPDLAAASAMLIASPEPGWPQFRGPRRDGVSDERGLLPSWPEGGPKLLWSVAGAGRGFSSPVIAQGRIFVTGDFGEDLNLLAFDLSGKPLWRTKNGAAWLNQYQGARASVTFSAGRIFHENAHGRVACVEAATGRELWSVNVLERLGGENITWGVSECLIVDERAVYVTAGGREGLVVALDKRDGKVLWRSEPLFDSGENRPLESAGYASPILIGFAGRRLIVGSSARHLYCVDADTGRLQWTRRRPTPYLVLAMMPVLVGDGVFMAAPYGPPAELCRLVAPAPSDAAVGLKEGWTAPLDTCQGGVVHANGRIFGCFYERRGRWAALDATDGRVLYETADFGKGSAVFADRRLYALAEDGWMLLLAPTDTQFEVKGRFRLASARDRDAWAHPVVYDGRLYLRYHDTLYCYDVRGR